MDVGGHDVPRFRRLVLGREDARGSRMHATTCVLPGRLRNCYMAQRWREPARGAPGLGVMCGRRGPRRGWPSIAEARLRGWPRSS